VDRIQTYREFWPFYLGEHSHPINRLLHFIGWNLGLAILFGCLATERWAQAPLGVVVGYGFAWVGHFVVEKNRPATFKYPLWSLISDFRMCALMWVGKLAFNQRARSS
jgi:hypothetical protein